MNDLISRQAAIDALHMHLMYRMGTDSNKKRLDDWINSLPSVQPKKRTEERTETHACDLIDRQAALDAIFSEPLYESGMKKRDADAVVPAIYEKIKALPPVYVPDTNVEDMISRDAAMEILMNQNVIMEGSEYHNGFNAGVNRAQEVIRNLPPVQPKCGEWEYHSNPTIGINPEDAYCSCCGFHVDTTDDIDFDEYNFCPRCGVKMEM